MMMLLSRTVRNCANAQEGAIAKLTVASIQPIQIEALFVAEDENRTKALAPDRHLASPSEPGSLVRISEGRCTLGSDPGEIWIGS